MSVEISGPEGYDFQYLNTLLFALEYLDKDEVEIYIEKKNEEDAQIIFSENEIKYTIDIQVKSKNRDIELKNFASWISHFESRSTNRCLMNKLNEEEDRYTLFVSNARCKDDISIFVDEGKINSQLDKGFNLEFINKLKESIKVCYSENNETSKSRNKFLKDFIESIKINDFRDILKRIKIRERYTVQYSKQKIGNLINKKFYVPQSKVEYVINKLIDKIRNSRGTDDSISSNLINIISKYSQSNILNRNDNYIERHEKELCMKILCDNNVLLLTGISFCGKSYLAKDIAQEYLEKGYKIERIGELYGDGGAISFIKHRSVEDRLLILEDPFGQVQTKKNSIDIFNDIRNLIHESESNRKIIVTTRKDVLLNTMLEKHINKCSIDSYNWIDLTSNSSQEMTKLWKKYYGYSIQSEKVLDDISQWLKEKEKISSLQLGHIANIYNAKHRLEDLVELKPVDIISTGRIDSNDFCRLIKKRGAEASIVFIALGLSCNTYKNVTLNDLAYILSNNEEKPGLYEGKKKYVEHTLNIDMLKRIENSHEHYPKYQNKYKIREEYIKEIRYFRQHGYIQIDNAEKVMFAHPIYHFATQLLFNEQFMDILERKDVINLVQNSLSSLSINANLCTLAMLQNLYIDNSDDELKKLILIGLDSIYPAVRDKVIMFFDRKINDLNEKEQKKFVEVLLYNQSIEINWCNGMPYINNSDDGSFLDDLFQDEVSNDVVDYIMKNCSDGIYISSEDMWNLLNINNNDIITLDILKKALSYDESFIRGKAIKFIFERYAFEFEEIDKYLNDYEHYEVIYNLFRGAISSWLKYNSESRNAILEYFKKSLNIMSVSIRAKEFLENFDDDYSSESINWCKVKENEKLELWNVWHELFVEFLYKFPSRYIRMNEPHMVGVLESSLKYIRDDVKVIELSNAWIDWLDRYLQYRLPHDYGMSVAEYLMKGTGSQCDCRENVILEMLSTEKTSFVTTNINIFLEYWNKLSEDEKRIILEVYKTLRKDIKWIKAVSLNSKVVPYDVQVEILGESIEGKNVSDTVDILIKNGLLEQCLNVYCGYPQPLWWNGYHHINKKLWDDVIVEVLRRDQFNQSFQIALREIIGLLYNDDKRRISNIYDVYECDLLKTSEIRRLVFERLLYETISQNQCNKKIWDLLLKYSSKEEKEIYYNKIVEKIELVQYWQISYGDLFDLFDNTVIYEEIYPRLEVDNSIKIFGECMLELYESVDSSNNFLKDDFERLRGEFIKYVTHLYKINPPRLSFSNKFVKYIIKEMEVVSPELEDLVERNRVRQMQIVEDLRKKYTDYYELVEWVD